MERFQITLNNRQIGSEFTTDREMAKKIFLAMLDEYKGLGLKAVYRLLIYKEDTWKIYNVAI